MDLIFFPSVIYYEFFSFLLPFAEWIIGTGVILLVVVKKQFPNIKKNILIGPFSIRAVMLTIALLGVFGSMPTSLLYGGIGGELGTSLGENFDHLFGFSWRFFELIFGITGTIASVMAMITWSILIWSIIGRLIGEGLYLILKTTKR